MEGKEWIWDNGIIKEHEIAEMKKVIESTSKNKLTGLEARIFEDFMSKL
jgi:hypothetical protein